MFLLGTVGCAVLSYENYTIRFFGDNRLWSIKTEQDVNFLLLVQPLDSSKRYCYLLEDHLKACTLLNISSLKVEAQFPQFKLPGTFTISKTIFPQMQNNNIYQLLFYRDFNSSDFDMNAVYPLKASYHTFGNQLIDRNSGQYSESYVWISPKTDNQYNISLFNSIQGHVIIGQAHISYLIRRVKGSKPWFGWLAVGINRNFMQNQDLVKINFNPFSVTDSYSYDTNPAKVVDDSEAIGKGCNQSASPIYGIKSNDFWFFHFKREMLSYDVLCDSFIINNGSEICLAFYQSDTTVKKNFANKHSTVWCQLFSSAGLILWLWTASLLI